MSRASGSVAMRRSASGSPVNGRLVGCGHRVIVARRHALARGDGRHHELHGKRHSTAVLLDRDPDAVAAVVDIEDRPGDAGLDRLPDPIRGRVGETRHPVEGGPAQGQRDAQVDDRTAGVEDLDAEAAGGPVYPIEGRGGGGGADRPGPCRSGFADPSRASRRREASSGVSRPSATRARIRETGSSGIGRFAARSTSRCQAPRGGRRPRRRRCRRVRGRAGYPSAGRAGCSAAAGRARSRLWRLGERRVCVAGAGGVRRVGPRWPVRGGRALGRRGVGGEVERGDGRPALGSRVGRGRRRLGCRPRPVGGDRFVGCRRAGRHDRRP